MFTLTLSFVGVDGNVISENIEIPQEHNSDDLILAVLRLALDLNFKASQ